MILWLTVLLFNFQPMQTEPKCILTGEVKGTPIIKNTLILSSYAKILLLSTRAHSLHKKRGTKSLRMDGGYLGWTNLTDPALHNTDFNIIKYSLKGSDTGSYRRFLKEEWKGKIH